MSHPWAFWGEEQGKGGQEGGQKTKDLEGGEKSPDSLLEDGGGGQDRRLEQARRTGR